MIRLLGSSCWKHRGAIVAIQATAWFVASGIAGRVSVLGLTLIILLLVFVRVLQAPDLVFVNRTHPVHMVKGFAGIAEPQVSCDRALCSVLTL